MSEFGYHGLERAALGFVLEDETWPAFLQWMRENHVSGAAHDWLEAGPDLGTARRQFMAHSPDAGIRALAGNDGGGLPNPGS